jgi:DNA primase (bacterial type)
MANSIPRDFIDRLVSDSDIVSVLGAYLDLQKKGNNYVCRCPFHEEKTGSFTVSPQKSIYHCFGCGKGGNVLTFIQEYEGLNFVEAVEKLAEINNVTVPRESRPNTEDYSNIYQLNQVLAESYLSALKDKKNKTVVDYLKERGITGETAKKFLIGYADFDQKELKKKLIDQFSEATLLKSGNFLKNEKGMYPSLEIG